jgi:N-acetylmuramic acid 6-phosphate etherase
MTTETVDPRFRGLDVWPMASVTAALLEGQMSAAAAAAAARETLSAAAEDAANRLSGATAQGRLIYVGAGASGRLAAQDGAELWPTFGWPHARLALLMAGGEEALLRSVEGAEDDADGASEATSALNPGPADVAVCVAASGRTPFVVEAARALRAAGGLTIGLSCNRDAPLAAHSDHPILLDTGAEVIAGSTRMAAGTAQKIAMNVLSTAIMVRLGRVHDNLMVDMAAANAKLSRRRIAMVQATASAGREISDTTAQAALAQADGWVKLAALIAHGHCPERSRAALQAADGRLRVALRALSETSRRNRPSDVSE